LPSRSDNAIFLFAREAGRFVTSDARDYDIEQYTGRLAEHVWRRKNADSITELATLLLRFIENPLPRTEWFAS